MFYFDILKDTVIS